MARFIPVVVLGLIAFGLLIGGVDPAWWIVGLVALGLGIAIATSVRISVAGRPVHLAPYVPALAVGLAALGLLLAGAYPAWWITGLVAVGIGAITFMSRH
jgi:hypothetical protein